MTHGIYRYVKLDLRLHSVSIGTCLQWRNLDTFEVEPMNDINLICGISIVNADSEDEVSRFYPVDEYPYRYFWMQQSNTNSFSFGDFNGNLG